MTICHTEMSAMAPTREARVFRRLDRRWFGVRRPSAASSSIVGSSSALRCATFSALPGAHASFQTLG
jgi:hypothetical protein